MISLAYILMRKTIYIFLPDYLPTLKWIAYVEFVQTQNLYTVDPVNNQTNLKSVWMMMLFFFFSALRRIKSGLLCAVHSLFQQLPLHH